MILHILVYVSHSYALDLNKLKPFLYYFDDSKQFQSSPAKRKKQKLESKRKLTSVNREEVKQTKKKPQTYKHPHTIYAIGGITTSAHFTTDLKNDSEATLRSDLGYYLSGHYGYRFNKNWYALADYTIDQKSFSNTDTITVSNQSITLTELGIGARYRFGMNGSLMATIGIKDQVVYKRTSVTDITVEKDTLNVLNLYGLYSALHKESYTLQIPAGITLGIGQGSNDFYQVNGLTSYHAGVQARFKGKGNYWILGGSYRASTSTNNLVSQTDAEFRGYLRFYTWF